MGVSEYVTRDGGHRYPVDTPIWRCPETGEPVNLTPGDGLVRADIDAGERSLWRYAKAVRVDKSVRVDLGEGCTPLFPISYGGGRPRLKMESMMPTGSFKDRGMAVLCTYLKANGVSEVLLDSSGNAAGALACFASVLGLTCTVLVPAHTSPAKVAQMRAYGATVDLVEGTRKDVSDKALALAETGVFYASHNWQPYFIEGTKTLAYEIWEQSGFTVPDNVVVPVGGGSNLLGCHIGFDELKRRGEIDRVPRLFAAQPATVGPLVRAYDAGATDDVDYTPAPTLAEGVAIHKPVRTRECMIALAETGGAAVGVPEADILPAVRRLARCGAFVEPSSAVAADAYERLVASGTIGAEEDTVVVLTGHGLKSIDALME
ncbi:MAG: threonine synthase [Thalassobaculaceae bacterium]|nr:threonine synthase [Thalassobaculaceae bacterium]